MSLFSFLLIICGKYTIIYTEGKSYCCLKNLRDYYTRLACALGLFSVFLRFGVRVALMSRTLGKINTFKTNATRFELSGFCLKKGLTFLWVMCRFVSVSV